MNKLLLILLCIPMIGLGQETENTISYKRGYGPKIIECFDDQRFCRYSKTDSIVEWESLYINGVLDSLTAWYNPGGLWSQTQYLHGLRNGKHIVYKDGGGLQYIQIYKNGILVEESN